MEKEIVSEEVIVDLADFFKVFGDATRLKILWVLFDSEKCVYDISEEPYREQRSDIASIEYVGENYTLVKRQGK